MCARAHAHAHCLNWTWRKKKRHLSREDPGLASADSQLWCPPEFTSPGESGTQDVLDQLCTTVAPVYWDREESCFSCRGRSEVHSKLTLEFCSQVDSVGRNLRKETSLSSWFFVFECCPCWKTSVAMGSVSDKPWDFLEQ